jgi:ABC-type branched-subunit amino acid transport system ATPase component
LLEVKDLHVGYGSADVLHGVAVTAPAGEITALIGPNGAGKSTLAHTIAGLLHPHQGSVRLEGDDLAGESPRQRARRGLGYTPQGTNVFPELTVAENLNVVANSLDTPPSRTQEILEQFPILAHRRTQRAGTLSGGERQQLAIGCSLLMEPKLLILDEPTTGLAPQVVSMLIEKILEIRDHGAGIVWIIEEHPAQILPHCQTVYLLESGAIKHSAAGANLLNDSEFTQMFLGASVHPERITAAD